MADRKPKKNSILNFILLICILIFSFCIGECQAGVISDAPGISLVLYRVLQFVLLIFGSVAIIGVVISGILYFVAAGDEKILKQAKNSFVYSIVGIVIALSGLILIRTMSGILG
jgi:hypothetical protein